MPTKDKETSTIFLHKVTAEIHSHLKKHKKNKYRFYAKAYILVGFKITNTLHNTEYPIHLKPAAQPHLKAEVQVNDHMLGTKNKQHKKSSSAAITKGEVQVHLLGQKHATRGY